MKAEYKLGKFGMVSIESPKSLAICFEVVAIWSSNPDQATLGRLCAGAIGLSTESNPILPSYRPERDKLLEYGYRCLERLLERGVTVGQIYEVGLIALMKCTEKLPNEEEVEKIENFISTPKGDI